MKNYHIKRVNPSEGAGRVSVEVHDGDKRRLLDPRPSQQVYNHSPDGFEFGYHGSGPAQLALAILLDFTDNTRVSRQLYQQFKADHIATLPEEGGIILGNTIFNWVSDNYQQE